MPGVSFDFVQAVRKPAAILLYLTGYLAASVRGAKGFEASGCAREGADRKVPSAIGADEGAAIHDAAVSCGPREDGHERNGKRHGGAKEEVATALQSWGASIRRQDEG
jgi:hypothetical protein